MKFSFILFLCCFYVSKSSKISISPEVPNNEETPFLKKKLSNLFKWLQRGNPFDNISMEHPFEPTAEEMYIIKEKRAKSWQANLFLIHPYLVLAGFIFSFLRTQISKCIPKTKIVVLSKDIKYVKEVDEEDDLVQDLSPARTSDEEFTSKIDFIPSRRELPSLQESFKLIRTQLTCQQPFDKNGLFYYLGYNSSDFTYKNPNLTGQVIVNMSTLFKGSPVTVVCHSPEDEGVSFPTYTENYINSWLAIDIGILYIEFSFCSPFVIIEFYLSKHHHHYHYHHHHHHHHHYYYFHYHHHHYHHHYYHHHHHYRHHHHHQHHHHHYHR
jgi:hypothetical protein